MAEDLSRTEELPRTQEFSRTQENSRNEELNGTKELKNSAELTQIKHHHLNNQVSYSRNISVHDSSQHLHPLSHHRVVD